MKTKTILQEARHEIMALRRRNELLAAKVEMVELFASVHRTTPFSQPQQMAPDIVYQMERAIDELAEAELPKTHEPPTPRSPAL